MSNRLNSPHVFTLEAAALVLKAAGYRISKPKEKKKDRVGPTFVACFADGQVTRMSTFTSLANLDVERGKRLARMAWESRKRRLPACYNVLRMNPLMARHSERIEELANARLEYLRTTLHEAPAVISASFEQDGKTLANYNWESIGADR